jgi:hypothetical protein
LERIIHSVNQHCHLLVRTQLFTLNLFLVRSKRVIEMQRSLTAADVSFVSLQRAVFCVQCELLSYNNTPRCLACGSVAVLSLLRVLGGSLHGSKRRISSQMPSWTGWCARCSTRFRTLRRLAKIITNVTWRPMPNFRRRQLFPLAIACGPAIMGPSLCRMR